MKDSKQYSKKVAAFFKKYKSATTLKPFDNEDKVDSLVYSVLYEHLNNDDVEACGDLMREHFIDWNELRVSRLEEVLDVLSPANLAIEVKKKVADQLIKTLNCVFTKYDRISFEDIEELGKRQANQELEELEDFTPFMINFLMLNFKASHSLPVNEMMAEYARQTGLVDSKADYKSISSFLQRQISVDEVYNFYLTLRQQTEMFEKVEDKPVKKTASKKSTKKKVAVKKSTKKATDEKVVKKTVKKVIKK